MAKPATTTETKAPTLIAWHIAGKEEKPFWTRIGAAWPHKDGKGFTLQIDMLPVSGRITLREPGEKTDGNGGSQ